MRKTSSCSTDPTDPVYTRTTGATHHQSLSEPTLATALQHRPPGPHHHPDGARTHDIVSLQGGDLGDVRLAVPSRVALFFAGFKTPQGAVGRCIWQCLSGPFGVAKPSDSLTATPEPGPAANRDRSERRPDGWRSHCRPMRRAESSRGLAHAPGTLPGGLRRASRPPKCVSEQQAAATACRLAAPKQLTVLVPAVACEFCPSPQCTTGRHRQMCKYQDQSQAGDCLTNH